MAQSKDVQKQNYPLPAYNFRVRIDETIMSFAEVSGIAVEYEKVTYRHGLSFMEGEAITTFKYDPFVTMTLKRGVVLGATPVVLLRLAQQGRPSDVSQSVYAMKSGDPVISWQIAKAVPVKIQAPAFDAKTNEVAIETVELAVRGITLVKN